MHSTYCIGCVRSFFDVMHVRTAAVIISDRMRCCIKSNTGCIYSYLSCVSSECYLVRVEVGCKVGDDSVLAFGDCDMRILSRMVWLLCGDPPGTAIIQALFGPKLDSGGWMITVHMPGHSQHIHGAHYEASWCICMSWLLGCVCCAVPTACRQIGQYTQDAYCCMPLHPRERAHCERGPTDLFLHTATV
jgi:hypothetical protein